MHETPEVSRAFRCTPQPLDEFEQRMRELNEVVDAEIASFLPRELDDEALEDLVGRARWTHDSVGYAAGLIRPLWDMLGRRGKRWRPAFGLLLLDVLEVDVEPY